MKRTFNFQESHWAISPNGTAHLYGTKYLGPTNTKGSRIVFAEISTDGNVIGKRRFEHWDNATSNNQAAQLQKQLGEDWQVLGWMEVRKAISVHFAKQSN